MIFPKENFRVTSNSPKKKLVLLFTCCVEIGPKLQCQQKEEEQTVYSLKMFN